MGRSAYRSFDILDTLVDERLPARQVLNVLALVVNVENIDMPLAL
jgi:hypothetical protein